jgi:hypothetical protein
MDTTTGSFVWDTAKERLNINKHGVDFVAAAEVFRDPKVRIFTDARHSVTEPRLFAVGKIGRRVMTVRFTYRGDKIRIFGAGYWSNTMKKPKSRDKNMPVGALTEVPNFLPPPEQLVFPDDTVKVTINLKRSSVDFFKRRANRCHTKYQRMIREVVDRYATQYGER